MPYHPPLVFKQYRSRNDGKTYFHISEKESNMQQRTAYGSFTYQGSVCIPLNVNIKCLWWFLSDP